MLFVFNRNNECFHKDINRDNLMDSYPFMVFLIIDANRFDMRMRSSSKKDYFCEKELNLIISLWKWFHICYKTQTSIISSRSKTRDLWNLISFESNEMLNGHKANTRKSNFHKNIKAQKKLMIRFLWTLQWIVWKYDLACYLRESNSGSEFLVQVI